MKNLIILVMAIGLSVLGYLLYTDRKSPTVTDDNQTTGTTASTSSGDEPVSATGKVLDLSNKNLNDLSTDILDDDSVTKLDVSENNLTGSLPAEIRKLSNLEVLDASNNKMTGIPAEIGQLSKLKSANFANNDLSGLPMEIGNLSNLETLDLRGNANISTADISAIQKEIPSTKILTD